MGPIVQRMEIKTIWYDALLLERRDGMALALFTLMTLLCYSTDSIWVKEVGAQRPEAKTSEYIV